MSVCEYICVRACVCVRVRVRVRVSECDPMWILIIYEPQTCMTIISFIKIDHAYNHSIIVLLL